MLHVALDRGVVVLVSYQPLGVKNGVDGDLILGRVVDETLGVCEGDIEGSRPISLVIGNNFNLVMLEDAPAGVGCAEVGSNSCFLAVMMMCRVTDCVCSVRKSGWESVVLSAVVSLRAAGSSRALAEPAPLVSSTPSMPALDNL